MSKVLYGIIGNITGRWLSPHGEFRGVDRYVDGALLSNYFLTYDVNEAYRYRADVAFRNGGGNYEHTVKEYDE